MSTHNEAVLAQIVPDAEQRSAYLEAADGDTALAITYAKFGLPPETAWETHMEAKAQAFERIFRSP